MEIADHSRRNFLATAAASTVMVLTSVPASAVAMTEVDPVFAAIETHAQASIALQRAEAAHMLAEREMRGTGDLFPRVVSIGNPHSGMPRPMSTSHEDVDRYTPADIYPQDNKREHAEMSAAIALRDTRMLPLQTAVDEAWDAEETALGDVVCTVPTTIDGVLALLKFQRQYSEGPKKNFMDGDLATYSRNPWRRRCWILKNQSEVQKITRHEPAGHAGGFSISRCGDVGGTGRAPSK